MCQILFQTVEQLMSYIEKKSVLLTGGLEVSFSINDLTNTCGSTSFLSKLVSDNTSFDMTF